MLTRTMRSYWREQSALFRLSREDIRTALPGWLHPPPLLDVPRRINGRNPFTGKPFESWTRVPRYPLVGLPDAVRSPSLERYPWVSTEGLQSWDMAVLTKLILQCTDELASDLWDRFLVGLEDDNNSLQPVSTEFVQAILNLQRTSIVDLGAAWLRAVEPGDRVPGWATRVIERVREFFAEAPLAEYYLWSCR